MKNNGYMMATKAYHKLGELSREPADLCRIDEEKEDCYIGRWVTGFGFFNVEFPKKTTRHLTDKEIEMYQGRHIHVNSCCAGELDFKEVMKG